jgi:two-component system LytT family response regulator
MIRAVIVDDEPYCCETLAVLLERYCPNVTVIDSCYNGMDALTVIQKQQPDLVFLDVEMPKMNGFEMLEQLPSINFDLIFTTSYNQYALKAFRFSAIDYLLKPVDREELQKAIKKLEHRSQRPITQQLEILFQKMNRAATPIGKIALPTLEGLQMVNIDSIISCDSDSNYTILRLKHKEKLTVSRTLKDVEELLEDHAFVRVHNSYLVNLNEIVKYVKGEGGYLVMSDGTNIDVSRSKKEILLKRLLPR